MACVRGINIHIMDYLESISVLPESSCEKKVGEVERGGEDGGGWG